MKKILIIFGTRPEAIKMATLFHEFKKHPNLFVTKVCITAQHREMLDQVLDFFSITPDYDLDLMTKNQNLYNLTSLIIKRLKPVLEDFKPDYVFVHGDTTTTMAASIASFYANSKICHVEAGLRTNNKLSPFPEEMNRQLTSRLADFHFAPTNDSYKNLILENIDKEKVIITGNTVIDSLFYSLKKLKKNKTNFINKLKSKIDTSKKVILITCHRRENHGIKFLNILKSIKRISKERKDVIIIFPVHLNPKIKIPANETLSGIENIILTEPMKYEDFIWVMNLSKIIISDSGGIQEEAPSLGKPVLVLRDETERPEAIESGNVILVGTDEKKIISYTNKLLDNMKLYKKISNTKNPYGDGESSKKIVEFIINLKLKK